MNTEKEARIYRIEDNVYDFNIYLLLKEFKEFSTAERYQEVLDEILARLPNKKHTT